MTNNSATKDGEIDAIQKKFQLVQATMLKDRADANKSLEEQPGQVRRYEQGLRNPQEASRKRHQQFYRSERKQKDEIRLFERKGRPSTKPSSNRSIRLCLISPCDHFSGSPWRNRLREHFFGKAQNVRPQQNLTFSVFSPGLPGHPEQGLQRRLPELSLTDFSSSLQGQDHPGRQPQRQPAHGWRRADQPDLEPGGNTSIVHCGAASI